MNMWKTDMWERRNIAPHYPLWHGEKDKPHAQNEYYNNDTVISKVHVLQWSRAIVMPFCDHTNEGRCDSIIIIYLFLSILIEFN